MSQIRIPLSSWILAQSSMYRVHGSQLSASFLAAASSSGIFLDRQHPVPGQILLCKECSWNPLAELGLWAQIHWAHINWSIVNLCWKAPLSVGICQEHKSLRSSFQLKWLLLTHFIHPSALSWPPKTDDCTTHCTKDFLHLGTNHAWKEDWTLDCNWTWSCRLPCCMVPCGVLCQPLVWYYYRKMSQMGLLRPYPSLIAELCIICSWDSLTLGCMANREKPTNSFNAQTKSSLLWFVSGSPLIFVSWLHIWGKSLIPIPCAA